MSSVKGFSPAFKSQQVYGQVVSILMEEISAFLCDTVNPSVCEVHLAHRASHGSYELSAESSSLKDMEESRSPS